MFAYILYRHKLLAYISAADSMGLSSFKCLWWAPKDAPFLQRSANRQFKVIQGRYFGINRKGVWEFLLVINSNFGHLAPFLRYGDLMAENCEFFLPHSHLTPSFGVKPLEFLDEFFIPKTTIIELSVGEDFVIL